MGSSKNIGSFVVPCSSQAIDERSATEQEECSRCPIDNDLITEPEEAGAIGGSYPTWETEQREDQVPQQAQASSTPEYPTKLVELTAPDLSLSAQDHYFVYQQSDRFSEQATIGGFAELVPLSPQLKPASALGEAAQVSGFQGCHEGCLMEVTNHEQDRGFEHTCTLLEQEQRLSLCNQPHYRSSPVDLVLTEGRVCNGIYIWKVHHFFQHRQNGNNGLIAALSSPPIYTHLYGYKLRMKFYLNGVRSGIGKHVGLFVQMMQGEYDDILSWPFTGRITLSILDQCGDEFRNDITGTFLAKPSLAAFQKPAANRVSQEYGFEVFAPTGQVCGVRYTKNDTMMLKVEISRL